MSKVVSRLCVFFIGIPVVLFVVFFPYCFRLPLHLLVCAACAVGACELYDLLRTKTPLLPKPLVVGGAVLLPMVAALYKLLPVLCGVRFPFSSEVITYAFILVLLFLLLAEVVTARDFEHSLGRLAGSVFVVLYAGYLLTFVSRMVDSAPERTFISSCVLAVFLLMVFLCDSIAWFFGVLLGKNNRGIVPASPNKSIAGFAGGFVGSISAAVLAHFLWPEFFGSVPKLIAVGVGIALASIVGDLVESVFKRSAGVKDSGHIIPGRGGLLDSIDSILMAAPVFCLLLSLLYPQLV